MHERAGTFYGVEKIKKISKLHVFVVHVTDFPFDQLTTNLA